jgi:hypothetical protein
MLAAMQAGVVAYLAYRGLVWVAVCVVVVAALWPERHQLSWAAVGRRLLPLVIGASFALLIALSPKAITQMAATACYGLWLAWRSARPVAEPVAFGELLAIQALALEALFLMAAIWHTPRPVVMALVWGVLFATSYQALAARGDRAAKTLAAAWAMVAMQVSWVLLTWLFSYITLGSYLIVPQPALVLTALAYCFGSIYVAQRRGQLGRARFAEYLLITFVLIWIVLAGTNWRGTL